MWRQLVHLKHWCLCTYQKVVILTLTAVRACNLNKVSFLSHIKMACVVVIDPLFTWNIHIKL